jgi:hypothetical protein
MARPIKETPILYGKDAVRIMERMQNVELWPREKIEEIKEVHAMCKEMEERGAKLGTIKWL